MTPEEHKAEVVRMVERTFESEDLAVERVKLRLRDGDKKLAKELRVEIERLKLPDPWHHRWPDGISSWLTRHDRIGFAMIIAAVILAFAGFIWAMVQFTPRHQDRREAVEAGKAEWYWTDDGVQRWRLIENPAPPVVAAETEGKKP